jgi:hypothetical protein
VNCCVEPVATLGVGGVTAMDDTVFAVTVSAAVPLMPLTVAVIVVEPAATPVARPAALTVAVAVLEELHVAVAVTFPLEPSL